MHPKLYLKLFETMEKFIEQNCASDEWKNADFYSPASLALRMSQAAENIFDATVEASKFGEDNAS
jgi:hypothetical protein